MTRFFLQLSVSIFIFFASIAYATDERKTPIKIGAIYGFTGFASTWSEQARRGVGLAVEEINRTGGINGRPIIPMFVQLGYSVPKIHGGMHIAIFGLQWLKRWMCRL